MFSLFLIIVAKTGQYFSRSIAETFVRLYGGYVGKAKSALARTGCVGRSSDDFERTHLHTYIHILFI